jgi:hypothetical protein
VGVLGSQFEASERASGVCGVSEQAGGNGRRVIEEQTAGWHAGVEDCPYDCPYAMVLLGSAVQ